MLLLKDKKKKKKKAEAEKCSDDDEEDEEDDEEEDDENEDGSPTKGRKRIRKIKSDKKLADTTIKAVKAEEQRRKRISEKQKVVKYFHQN